MDCSMPGFPVLHNLPEFAQTHVHWVSDAIQLLYPLLPTSPPALDLSQLQGLFEWVSSSIRCPKHWHFNFNISPSNEHPGLISLGRTGWISLQSEGLSRVFSNTTVQKHQFFGTQLSSQFNSHIHTCIYTRKTDFQNGAVTYPRPSRSVAKLLLFLRLHATSAH